MSEQKSEGNVADFSDAKRNRLALRVQRGRKGGTPEGHQTVADELPWLALGTRDQYVFVLTAERAFFATSVDSLSRPSVIRRLYAAHAGALARCHPVYGLDPDTGRPVPIPGRHKQTDAMDTILRLCAQAGEFRPEQQLRGRGAWRDVAPDGTAQVVLHCGDGLYLPGNGDLQRLTYLHGYAYPAAAPALPAPYRARVPQDDSPGAWLVEQCKPWCWELPALAPVLVAGWVCAALLAGALSNRPSIAIGGASDWHGRDVLRLVKRVLGPYCPVAADASHESIADLLTWDSLGVLIDAGEAMPPPARYPRRPQWSQDVAYGRRFHAMQIGLAEAIAGAGERARVIDLDIAGPIGRPVLPSRAQCEDVLPMLLRRMLDRYSALHDDVAPAIASVLQERGADQDAVAPIAVLLAAWWCAVSDAPFDEAALDPLADDIDELLLRRRGVTAPAHERIATLFFGLLIDPRTAPIAWSRTATVRELISIAAGYRDGEADLAEPERRSEPDAIHFAAREPECKAARRVLGHYGLTVIGQQPGHRQVAIAYTAALRTPLIDKVKGLAGQGPRLARVLAEAPGAERPKGTRWFPGDGSQKHVTVPLEWVLAPLAEHDSGIADAWREAHWRRV